MRIFTTALLLVLLIASGSHAAQRAVYIEEISGIWCGFCPPVDPILEGLVEDYGDDQLILVNWHIADVLEHPDVYEWYSNYGIIPGPVPLTTFDGTTRVTGLAGDLSVYATHVSNHLAVPA